MQKPCGPAGGVGIADRQAARQMTGKENLGGDLAEPMREAQGAWGRLKTAPERSGGSAFKPAVSQLVDGTLQ